MALLLLALLTSIASADELIVRAQALLDQGKASEAYELLDPIEGARAADASFDLLLGIAALESGQNTRSLFARQKIMHGADR